MYVLMPIDHEQCFGFKISETRTAFAMHSRFGGEMRIQFDLFRFISICFDSLTMNAVDF